MERHDDDGVGEASVPLNTKKRSQKDIHKEGTKDVVLLGSSSSRRCCSQRWIMAYMGVWLGIMTYLLSTNMSITVVCMVKQDDVQIETLTHENSTDSKVTHETGDIINLANGSIAHMVTLPLSVKENISYAENSSLDGADEAAATTNQLTGEFTWSRKEQSVVLSGYFYGYMLVQAPGGWLGTKYGGRRVVGCCMTVAAVLTLLVPVIARSSLYLVIAARILLGVTVGMALPNFCGLVGVWALPTETSRMTGFVFFGQMIGAILAYSTSGVLCVNGFDNGWASVFYIHGMFGLLFVVCWWYCVYSSTGEHPRISEEERNLIMKYRTNLHIKKKPPIPWRKIFTYIPFYVSYTAHVCDTWTFYLLLTCLPQYLKEILEFDIQSNGLLSCVPFLCFLMGGILAGSGADFIRSKTSITITTIRKVFLITGFMGTACFILVPGFLTSQQRDISIICLSFSQLFQALELIGGYSANAVDIAPRYASIIYGISNTFGSIPGAVVPLLVAIITKNQTVAEWRVVFYISAAVSVFACVVYGLFANNEPAKWADLHEDIEIEVDSSKKLQIVAEKEKQNNLLLA